MRETLCVKDTMQVICHSTILGKEIDVYGTAEEPLFKAKDVADWIGHTNTSKMVADAQLDELESVSVTMGTLTNSYTALMLTEDGLYEVLMQSRKPIAKQFKKGVKEILKQIRTKGGYISAREDESPEEIMAKALRIANETLARREERIRSLQTKIEEDAPRVLFSKAVETAKRSVLVAELAKILQQNGISIGQNRLFEWLRNHGYLCSKGKYRNQPTQKAMEQKLFEIKQTSITKPDGSTLVTTTTKVTGKGQVYFVNKFLSA